MKKIQRFRKEKPSQSSRSTKRILQLLCFILAFWVFYLWETKNDSQTIGNVRERQAKGGLETLVSSPSKEKDPFSHKYQNKVNKYLKTFMNEKRLRQMQSEIQLHRQLPLISDLAKDRDEGEVEFPIGGSTLNQEGNEKKIDEHRIDVDINAEREGIPQAGSAPLLKNTNMQSTFAFKQWQKQLPNGEKKFIRKWIIEKAKKEGYRIHLNNDFVITKIQDVENQRQPSSPPTKNKPIGTGGSQ